VLVVVTSVVVVGAAVVVGAVVGGAVVVVGSVTGGWVLVAPKVENASVLVVVLAVVGAWPLTGLAALVGLLTARGPVAEVVVERVGALVGARGAVVGVNAGLGAGSVGRARAGAQLGGPGWGSRVAEATRAARTPVVSPKATSMSRQGHRDLVRCRGGDGRCRGGGVDMVHCPGSTSSSRPVRPTLYERCLVVSRYAVSRIRPKRRIRQLGRDQRAEPWSACPGRRPCQSMPA
jgi:hypothetical protein